VNYTLLITASPTASRSGLTALRFARALLTRGHQLPLVFFLDEGTRTGTAAASTPSDETDLLAGWVELAGDTTELVLCVSSAQRRGLLDATAAQREDSEATVHPAFRLGGLGELVEALATSDRVVTFG
tara:strand:+ start:82152 stop:82535 length:384 start_codon:yes stop_codon:yes gene_type:complete